MGLHERRLPESVPRPPRSAPFLRKQAALDEILSRYLFSSSSSIQAVYVRLSTGVYFTSTTLQVRMTENLSLLVVQSSACSPTEAPLRSSL